MTTKRLRPAQAGRRGRITTTGTLHVQFARVQHELAATSHQVAALPRIALAAVAPALAQAERETVRALRSWLATVEDGNERYTAQQRRNTLLHLRTALAAIERLNPSLLGGLSRASEASGAMSVRNLTTEVARFSEIFEGSAIRIQLNLGKILALADRALIPRFASSARRYVGNVRRDIERELAIGVLRGETIFELTNRLQRIGGPRIRPTNSLEAANDIGEGLFTRYRYWAERVARTEVMNAYNVQLDEGLHETRDTIPDLRRRWDATEDSRTCPWCRDLDGEVRGLDEQFEDGLDGAPAHPNCRCRVGAWRDVWSSTLAAVDIAA